MILNSIKSAYSRTGYIFHQLKGTVDKYISNLSPTQKKAFLAGYTAMTLIPTKAHAEDGFAGLFNISATQAKSISSSVAIIFVAVGVCIAGVGGFNFYKRTQESSRGGAAETSLLKCFGPIVAGAVLAGTGFMVRKGGETVGVDSSEYGKLPS